MPSRTIAIGDIHGCLPALDALLDEIKPAADDLLIPLGDFIDRGPDSRGVIDRLIALSDQCRVVPLIGNHEIMMLAALERVGEIGVWQMCGGQETLASYSGRLDAIPQKHVDFVKGCRRHHETADYLFFHANYQADLPPDEQPDYLLLWEHLTTTQPAPHESGKTAIVGHTPQRTGDVLDLGHVLCIDTACCMGGCLTALDVNTRDIWQAEADGTLRS